MVAAKTNIIPLQEDHFPDVARIYEEGLATGIASFETRVPDWLHWDKKFLSQCRFVAVSADEIVGWCALSPVSSREVYQGVAEVTIYIKNAFQGMGIGRSLLSYLVSESEKEGFWTLQAGIFPENTASISLHKKCGFRIMGVREKPAKRNGVWYDNVLLERRSRIVGAEGFN